MNNVNLIGNLATDVDVKDVEGGKKVASFLVAVDRPGDRGADFIRVSTWDRQAEVCGQYLAKGKRVGVDGRLRSRSWEEADGKRRSSLEVVANRVQFLSPPDGAPAASQTEDIPFEPATA